MRDLINKSGIKVAALSAAVALVSACSDPSDPDSGTSLSSTSVSGVAIDGYLARATVYADLNDDGRLNAGEPSALTDKDGYFSTSKDDVDYCASSATEQNCLRIQGTLPDEVVLRTVGGFDVFTGEPFIGELSAVVEPLVDGTIPDQMITPLSSVLKDADAAVLTNLGLTSDQTNKDFIDESFDAEAANRAFLLHKIAVIFASVFEDTYDYFGEEAGFPEGASSLIYEAFTAELASSGTIDRAMLTRIFDDVDQEIVDIYAANNDGTISRQLSSGSTRSGAIDDAEDVIGLVNTAVPESGLTADQIRARMIGVEMVVSKMTDNNVTPSDLTDALNEALDTSGGLYTALGDGTGIDFSSLLEVDYSQATPDYDSVSISGGVSFADLGDKELFVEINDTSEGISGAALVLFDQVGEETESGDLKLCIRYNDSNAVEDYETEGALFNAGEWEKLDDRRVVISVLGQFDFTLISRGQSDGGRNIFSMSFSGETETWDTTSTLEDLATNSENMETHADCKARLQELD